MAIEIIAHDTIEFNDKKKTIIVRGHFDKTICYLATMATDLILSKSIEGTGSFSYIENREEFNTSRMTFKKKKTYEIVKHWLKKSMEEYINEREDYTDGVYGTRFNTYTSRERWYDKQDDMREVLLKYKNKENK